MLENARTRTRVSVQEVLLPILPDDVVRCCKRSTESLGIYIEMLKGNGLWGASLFEVPIDSLVKKARTPYQLTSHDEDETYCPHMLPNKRDGQKTRYSKLKELTASAGLCLGCVRLGNVDAKFSCDLHHKDGV